MALIRVYVALLSAAQTLYDKKGYGKDADPWMTLIGYFNSMRELGGMRRLVDDDVRTRLGKMEQRGLSRRSLYSIDELTSRKDSTDIPEVLDHLEAAFDLAAEAYRKEMQKKGRFKELPKRPLDVLLATNMVSVGVDVQRLGLMVVAGQPKTTAEYIQATSRVGRRFPGLVFTVFNWTRPRDLSHYERFEHYHATFYKHVEALSVTPFALGAISRGLTALLISCVRLQGTEFNSNKQASRIDRNHPFVKAAIETIVRRAELVGNKDEVQPLVLDELNERIDQWLAEAQRNVGGRILGYDEERDGVTVGLLNRPSLEPWDDFTCLNSLRDVEPTVGLIFHDGGLDEDPAFVAAVSEDSDAEDDEQQEEEAMSGQASEKRKIGDLRPSQLLYTFGVGAIVELPNLSVMVMGLDDWPVEQGSSEIPEPRLLRAVQRELGRQVAKLLTPPMTPESTGFQSNPFDETANVGVPVAPFPRWLVCPHCRLLAPDPVRLVRVEAGPVPKGPQPVRSPDLPKAGQAAHCRPRSVPGRLRREATWTISRGWSSCIAGRPTATTNCGFMSLERPARSPTSKSNASSARRNAA